MRIETYLVLPQQAKSIREEVFIKEQGFQKEFDEIDDSATHIVAFDGELGIAVCRVFWNDTVDSYVLGRLAVRKEYRGRNIGAQMVRAAEEYVRSQYGKQVQLHAQCSAVSFYNKLGYVEYGEIEKEEYCPHVWMKKKL